jgi:hypothetical protein
MAKSIRIGCGAGFSGDRIDPAIELAKSGDLDYLVFECLAERTIAYAQSRKLVNPKTGYDLLLEKRLREVLAPCIENKTKIITNMGAANPLAAGGKTLDLLAEMDISHMKVGVVFGDDIIESLIATDFSVLEEREGIKKFKDSIISANVYIGASSIIKLFNDGCDIIITGRTCDPSLFLAPMMVDLEWKDDDWDKIGIGIALAHLLECGAQVTGGYFADPGYKDVKGLANLGFPIAEVFENGEAIITKLQGTGGEVSLRTVKEQLLYEVHNPSKYITADGIADFTKIELEEMEKDSVKITGGGGRARPNKLKVSVGYRNGFLGEVAISYGGFKAKQRAELAARILMERIAASNMEFQKLRFDFIGAGSLWFSESSLSNEIRLRVLGRSEKREDAEKLCCEVEGLYTNGPAGGGGVTMSVDEEITITTAFIQRDKVSAQTMILEVENGKD